MGAGEEARDRGEAEEKPRESEADLQPRPAVRQGVRVQGAPFFLKFVS